MAVNHNHPLGLYHFRSLHVTQINRQVVLLYNEDCAPNVENAMRSGYFLWGGTDRLID